MGRLVMLAAMAGLSCCAPNVPQQQDARLVGAWLMMTESADFPAGCFSDQTVQYRSDGTYSIWGEGGHWLLERGVLTETAVAAEPLLVDVQSSRLGTPNVSTLRWNGRDRFWKQYADGRIFEFRRCPGTSKSVPPSGREADNDRRRR